MKKAAQFDRHETDKIWMWDKLNIIYGKSNLSEAALKISLTRYIDVACFTSFPYTYTLHISGTLI